MRHKNAAHRLDHFLSHNTGANAFAPGEVITLLHVKEASKPQKMIDGKPVEIIIRLVPKE